MAFSDEDRFFHMDVLCLKTYLNYILAGVGSNLFIYDNQSLLLSLPIFSDERVHGIYVHCNLIFLKGVRQVALIKLNRILNKISCQFISNVKTADWIQDVIVFNQNLIGLTTAHNLFEIWDVNLKTFLKISSCPEKCLLYSCRILGNTPENVLIFAGTVFGDVLIWTPCLKKEESLLQRFKGHNGAVFSIEVNLNEKILTTTSDDRSLRIWSTHSLEPFVSFKYWKNCQIQLIHTVFGHTARVWRSLVISNFFVTIGEDSQLVIWKKDGTMLKKLSLHQESGIRGLCCSEDTSLLITGGEDGGINYISWQFLTSHSEPPLLEKEIDTAKNYSTKVCFIKNGYIFTKAGECVMVTTTSEEIIYKSENFRAYCVLEVHSQGNYIFLGSINGHIVKIDVEAKIVLIDGQYLNGRIYYIHCLSSYVLTCTINGKLDLWEHSDNILKHFKAFELPVCKERWPTSSLLMNDNLFIGDRMGNIHIYNLSGSENPIQSYKKIHSCLGVTDMVNINSKIFTIGRDGTIKTFTKDLVHSTTSKLPMEWPWKIIKYKDDELVLGFHSVYLVVWSSKYREIIASKECGGGHRSCHIKLNGNILNVLYVKEKKILMDELVLDIITRVRQGFHGREINCLRIIEVNPTVVVTGSEDTTLRISKISKSDIEPICVLKTHTSSIRALHICPVESRYVFVISAGGKGEIAIWKFDLNSFECVELINHRLHNRCQMSKCNVPSPNPDTRFMCIDASQRNDLIVATGCSDCRIRLFLYNKNFNLISTALYSHCILNIAILQVPPALYLASMGTNGHVVFWRLTDSYEMVMLDSFQIHQSGINCYGFLEVEPGKFIVVTGGDDNKINMAFIELEAMDVKFKILWENSNAHYCQVTGIKLMKNILLTTSIDQKIIIWMWSYKMNKFEVFCLDKRTTAVSDIHGMDAKWCSNDQILVSVFGKGVEIFKINSEMLKTNSKI